MIQTIQIPMFVFVFFILSIKWCGSMRFLSVYIIIRVFFQKFNSNAEGLYMDSKLTKYIAVVVKNHIAKGS